MRLASPNLCALPGWKGRLELAYGCASDGRTELRHVRHEGPLRVQRAFRQPDGRSHTYIIHPPGGVVGGDRLEVEAALARGSRVLITTPGATKFYRSSGAWAVQETHLQVVGGARLEWLPQETIVFRGARAKTRTRIELYDDARLAHWEVTCLGRPAAGESFDDGELTQRLEVFVDGRLRWLDHARYGPTSSLQSAGCGLRSHCVIGSFLYAPCPDGALDELLQLVENAPNVLVGLTRIDTLLVARVLSDQGDAARRVLLRAWQTLRQASDGSEGTVPRVWAT